MLTERGKISLKQLNVLNDLDKGPKEAARRNGIHISTIYYWLENDPHFRLQLSREQAARIEMSTAKYVKLYDRAADTLDAALNGEKIGRNAMAAANAIVRTMPKLLEMVVIHSRVAAMEERLAQLLPEEIEGEYHADET